jgi:hypothetical protein
VLSALCRREVRTGDMGSLDKSNQGDQWLQPASRSVDKAATDDTTLQMNLTLGTASAAGATAAASASVFFFGGIVDGGHREKLVGSGRD